MIALESFAAEAARPPAAGRQGPGATTLAEAFAALLAVLSAGPPPVAATEPERRQRPVVAFETASVEAGFSDLAPVGDEALGGTAPAILARSAPPGAVVEPPVPPDAAAPVRDGFAPAGPEPAGPSSAERAPTLSKPDRPVAPFRAVAREPVARSSPPSAGKPSPQATIPADGSSPAAAAPSADVEPAATAGLARGFEPDGHAPSEGPSDASGPAAAGEPARTPVTGPAPDGRAPGTTPSGRRSEPRAPSSASPGASQSGQPGERSGPRRAGSPVAAAARLPARSSVRVEPRLNTRTEDELDPGPVDRRRAAEPISFALAFEPFDSRRAPPSPAPAGGQDSAAAPSTLAAPASSGRPAPSDPSSAPVDLDLLAGAAPEDAAKREPLAVRPLAAPLTAPVETAEPPAVRLLLRPEAPAGPARPERAPRVRLAAPSRRASADAPARFALSEPSLDETAGSGDSTPADDAPHRPVPPPRPVPALPAAVRHFAARASEAQRANAPAGSPMPPAAERPVAAPAAESERPLLRPPLPKTEAPPAAPLPEALPAAGNSPAPVLAEPSVWPAAPPAGDPASMAPPLDEPSDAEPPDAEPSRVETARLDRDAGRAHFEMVLGDDRLGRVSVRLVERAGLIDLMVRAENPATARALRESLPVLVESLAQARLRPEAGAFAPGERGGAAHEERERREQRRENPRRPRVRAAAAFREAEV